MWRCKQFPAEFMGLLIQFWLILHKKSGVFWKFWIICGMKSKVYWLMTCQLQVVSQWVLSFSQACPSLSYLDFFFCYCTFLFIAIKMAAGLIFILRGNSSVAREWCYGSYIHFYTFVVCNLYSVLTVRTWTELVAEEDDSHRVKYW